MEDRRGTYWIDDEEQVAKIRQALFDKEGHFAKDLAGRDALAVANKAGVTIPENTKIIAVKVTEFGHKEQLSAEKICPVLSVIAYDRFEEGRLWILLWQTMKSLEKDIQQVFIHLMNNTLLRRE